MMHYGQPLKRFLNMVTQKKLNSDSIQLDQQRIAVLAGPDIGYAVRQQREMV